MKRLSALLLIIMMFMTGCSGPAVSSGMAMDNETLVYGSGDYTAINPALFEHGEINALIFAGLTAHDAENNVVAGLAEEWSFDETSLTWTFKLREGLTFHDGHPLTSSDVKFTLEAILNPDNMSEIVSNYKDIEEITCPDNLTVTIKLSRNNVAFPDYMTIGILPEHLLAGEKLTTCDFNRNPVGAGPYKMTAWDMGQSITMEKFDGYYDGEPNIDRIIFKIVPDTDARAMQLESGEVDMAQITAKTAGTFRENANYSVYQMRTADYRAIAYNFWNPYFQAHPELSTILSYAIDREAIVESVLLGEGAAAYSPLQMGPYNHDTINKFEYNPEKVKSLLEEAGWTMGSDGYYEKDGDQLAFTIAAMSDDQVRVDMATMCANQLQAIGANVTAETRPSLDWGGQFACIIGWGSPFDPDDHTYKVFTTDAGDNYTGYSNPEIDRILTAARSTSDDAERQELYHKFQEAMTVNMPYSFLAYVDADYVMKSQIRGITPETVLGHHGVGVFWNIAEWSIEE